MLFCHECAPIIGHSLQFCIFGLFQLGFSVRLFRLSAPCSSVSARPYCRALFRMTVRRATAGTTRSRGERSRHSGNHAKIHLLGVLQGTFSQNRTKKNSFSGCSGYPIVFGNRIPVAYQALLSLNTASQKLALARVRSTSSFKYRSDGGFALFPEVKGKG
jgi:hypothetical protein